MSLPEDDLTCPVCCDIFTDPILLPCGHSFCRSCLKKCRDTGLRECPVCRKRATKSNLTSNLALKNVCEAVVQARRQSSVSEEDKMICTLHRERLKLFCLVDKQPICVVCQSSKLHKSHDCSPIEEALLDCKVREIHNCVECCSTSQASMCTVTHPGLKYFNVISVFQDELALSLKNLQVKLQTLQRIYKTSTDMFKHIKVTCSKSLLGINKTSDQAMFIIISPFRVRHWKHRK